MIEHDVKFNTIQIFRPSKFGSVSLKKLCFLKTENVAFVGFLSLWEKSLT